MGYKFSRALKKYKRKILATVILWAILTIVFVCPLSIAIRDYQVAGGGLTGGIKTEVFIKSFGDNILKPFISLGTGLSANYIDMFFKCFIGFSLFYGFFILIGFLKGIPKYEYEDIEHGSSDWSENGEQYSILSQDKGIILAQDNYLPVDKRGNVNVLVVGGSGSRKINILCYT